MSVEWPSVKRGTCVFLGIAHIFRLARYRHECASSRVKLLGCRQGDGEEGVGRAEHFESSI